MTKVLWLSGDGEGRGEEGMVLKGAEEVDRIVR